MKRTLSFSQSLRILGAVACIGVGIAYYQGQKPNTTITNIVVQETTQESVQQAPQNTPPQYAQPTESSKPLKKERARIAKQTTQAEVIPTVVPTAMPLLKSTRLKKGKTLEERAHAAEERELYEFNMLKDPATGKIPADAAQKALEAAREASDFTLPSVDGKENAGSVTVVPRGPNNFGGRTRAIGIDVRNSNIMLAGGVSSGVFRTTNGGTTWTRVTPTGQIHNVTALVQDPRPGNQDTWYYGGGEASGNSTTLGSSYRGHGVWKSTDNGLTWAVLSSTQGVLENFDNAFDYAHRLVVDSTTGYVYAAAGNSIRRSTDGGTTWTQVLGTFTNTGFTDIIVTPKGRLYAAFNGADANNGVWTSLTGASGSWTRIAGTGATTNHANWNAQNAYGRVVLAYAPSDTNTVFALYYNNTNSSCSGTAAPEAEFFRWNQSTTTWTDLSANLPNETGCLDGNDPFAVQGGYDLCVVVKPDDANTVVIGGTNVYRSTDGFTSTAATKRIGGYVSASSYGLYANHHPDIHFLLFAKGDNTTLYTGTDGGVHKTNVTSTTPAWTSLNNNYVTYQYYHIDINPNTAGGAAIAGGAQDNGTTIAGTGTTHFQEWSGDGCQTQFIQYTSNSNYDVLVSSQSGNIYRNTATTYNDIRPSSAASSTFVTYYHLDPDNTNFLYFASATKLYRTRIARTIAATTVTDDPATGWQLFDFTTSGNIQYIATSRNTAYSNAAYSATNSNRVMYITTASAKVYRVTDPAFGAKSATLTNITPAALTSGVVSSVSVNPYDDNEVIVTVANYGVSSVYHSTNAKAATPTWTIVEGVSTGAVALGSARSSVITRIGGVNTYFVGNSTGLFCTQSLNGTSTVWDRVGSSEINYAVCSSMRLRVDDNKIALGTHGNGAFELQLPVALPLELASFEGKAIEKANKLSWTSLNEVNFEGYTIERSADGKNFTNIGFVKGRNTTAQNNYSFDDTDKFIVKSSTPQYYRLKMTDIGVAEPTYSKTIVIQRPQEVSKTWDFALSPNPTNSDLTVDMQSLPDTKGLTIAVMDLAGRILLNINRNADEMTQAMFTIPTQNLVAGTYFVKIISNEGVSKVQKFVKN